MAFGGRTEHYHDAAGQYRVRWVPDKMVKGVAYDTPVPGYRAPTVNMLRLWKAEATESFDFDAFNVGDYYGAVDQKVAVGDHFEGAVSERRARELASSCG